MRDQYPIVYIIEVLCAFLSSLFAVMTIASENPEVRFRAEDNTEHSVWPVRDPTAVFAIQKAFEGVTTTYIADGHHRSASAFRYGYRHGSLIDVDD